MSVEKIKYDTKNKKFLPRMWAIWSEYFNVRIMSGKVFPDIFFFTIFLTKKFYRLLLQISRILIHTPPMKLFLFLISKLLLIQGIKVFMYSILDGLVLWGKYYYVFFLSFLVAFSSIFILLRSLQNSVETFFILFIPLLLLNGYSLAILYYFIDRREKGENISFLKTFQECLTKIKPVTITTLFHLFFSIELVVFFFMFGLLLSTYFDILAIDWRTSIPYWFFVITFGCLIVITLFIFNIFSYQAFFSILLEKRTTLQAFTQAKQLILKYLSQFLLYYVLLSVCFLPFIYFANVNFSDVGLAFLILLYSQAAVFFSFLLRRSFLGKNIVTTGITIPPPSHKGSSPYLFSLFFLVGMASYVLSAWFIIQVYPRAIQLVKQHYEETVIIQSLVHYENPAYGYRIDYPQSWSSYEWGENAITFAGSYTNTPVGFLSLTVIVAAAEESEFDQYYNSKPGLLYYDPTTKDIMTKTSNLLIDGAEAVKYTYVKNGATFTEYQIHYLIRKEGNVYDVSFTTRSKEVERANERLFNKIIDSFTFI